MKKVFISLFVILSLVIISCPEDEIDDTVEHTVTFKDGDTVIKTIKVIDGSSIPVNEFPNNLTKDGYDFGGWSLADGSKEKIPENHQFTANTTVYAIWNAESLYTPQFWWGNYIPETAINATDIGVSILDINELVANRANSRGRFELDWNWEAMDDIDWDEWGDIYGDADNIIFNSNGTKSIFAGGSLKPNNKLSQYAIAGAARWQEARFSSDAIIPGDKLLPINYPDERGYIYFISQYEPIVQNAGGTNVSTTWVKHPVTIDDLPYFVWRIGNAMTTTGGITFRFQFP